MARAGKYAHAAQIQHGGGSRASMRKAGAVVLRAAKAEAAKVGIRPAEATTLHQVDENTIMIATDPIAAPNARPAEFGLRHPLNYPSQRYADDDFSRIAIRSRWSKHWSGQNRKNGQKVKPYLDKAMESAFTAAVDVYGDEETVLLADEYGLEVGEH